jgi:hypothetical protein
MNQRAAATRIERLRYPGFTNVDTTVARVNELMRLLSVKATIVCIAIPRL